ncbi:uncharacterized protein LOC133914212 [Phragmites australis]|uniref:uncharacterized protein LOC133914212 n=1 Tax=Phragmites australis TaxID=29695 RepID=UPI002D77D16F|nr:uncharacterized protein LOC133914212 [Phragmites australis]
MPKFFNARQRPASEAHESRPTNSVSNLSPQNMHQYIAIINTLLHPSPPLPRNHNSLPTNSLQSKKPSACTAAAMEIESIKCECCDLREDCTPDYIASVRASFHGQWLCGLCCEAVRDEACRKKAHSGVEEAVRAHMAFCKMFKSNPAVRVADGVRQMLRRRSSDMSKPDSAKKYSTSQVGDESSVALY